MREEDMQIRAIAENKSLKEQLRLEKEMNEDNSRTLRILHNRITSALSYMEYQKYYFANNNKCCKDGLEWLSKEITLRLLGKKK